MSEKNPKGYDDLMEDFYNSISDLTKIIIDSTAPNEIVKTFTPAIDSLKEKFYEIVIPAITRNVEDIISKINKEVNEIAKTEE